ncbi:NAD(P)/FAD-dependent oxidoreductase [Paenibacillus zeisoli]|uniref:NAD(P)/FAD-dependent oxidoreductase n=1 Tax=Paenibacillus zeisoli TaxID=2496267 RepID=A0A3S1D7B0_9BACL|nr:NAD(P)/FAD-dependent oxidoreductase [Paenibacillus zeisoli]RUT28987.1 NAD(P)/FAD-dependent oxidoreductase [Paenibacillus zeisoli]
MLDCIIVGGGPAGLNAALVLGRARRKILLFDDNRPRNAVTQESHGFITRDGATPAEFRQLAHQDIQKYSSVEFRTERIATAAKHADFLEITTSSGAVYHTKKLLLATGLKEVLPGIPGIEEYYGRSIFSCPYCDGWELRDQPLAIISEDEDHALHLTRVLWNWSRQLLVCTNGKAALSPEFKHVLRSRNIAYSEHPITHLIGRSGRLERIRFSNQEEASLTGGFIKPDWFQSSELGRSLGCAMNPSGGLLTDEFGRTSVAGVYAAGDTSVISPSQVIIAAGEGSRAAIGINTDLAHEEF